MQQYPLVQTKLHIPSAQPGLVPRSHLIERLNAGLNRKLTLISAPAGFGKTTLVSEWVNDLRLDTAKESKIVNRQSAIANRVAWLSLDKRDNDPTRFLAYLIGALQTLSVRQSSVGNIGEGVLAVLQTPQPPSTESILTALINEIVTIPDDFVLVLDDYHVIDAKPIDQALTFLLDHLPSQMHLVIATRENPQLPLARYRAKGQLTELRAADLRFTPGEAAEFLNQVMGLNLSAEDIATLETRTEGWIAGLQLAALALQGTISTQGRQDVTSFIESFTGSHYFVLDFLMEEVLNQQPEGIQAFLLCTSILERMCGPLCDAVRFGSAGTAVTEIDNCQEILEYLERANLFIVPLDNERRWYRYHHLFAGFLRQRLLHGTASWAGDEGQSVAEYHIRASQWYEDNSLALEAFHHAAAANDIERAERLIKGGGIPLHLREAAAPVLNWLSSLPTSVLDARPSLSATYASLLLVTGQTTGVEERLWAAEAALAEAAQGDAEPDDKTRNLVGQIAAARATLALTQYQVETMIAQSRRALEYLHPDNLSSRTTAILMLANAYELQGDRTAAGHAYTEAISISQASGNIFFTMLATIGLGEMQVLENQLYLATETYQRALHLFGDHPHPAASDAYLGLARICYQWNDLDAAQQHGQQSLQLARLYDGAIDRFVISEVFLARLKLAQGDVTSAAALLAKVSQIVRRKNFVHRMAEVAAAQVLALVKQGNLAAAADLAEKHELPISQARVHLAQGDTAAALAVLEPRRQQVEAKGWQDERLKVMVLQAVALHTAALQADGEKGEAVQLLVDALALAEPGGFIRIFVDEGLPMAQLLSEAAARGLMPDYVGKLLAAFEAEAQKRQDEAYLPPDSLPPGVQPLIEPLTPREREVLQLIAAGHSNPEIAEELVIAVTTVKTHVKHIYGKLQVSSRFEAAARAQDLNLL